MIREDMRIHQLDEVSGEAVEVEVGGGGRVMRGRVCI